MREKVTYIFLVGDITAFESISGMLEVYQETPDNPYLRAIEFTFDGCPELALYIGRGYAYEAGWSSNDSLGVLLSKNYSVARVF